MFHAGMAQGLLQEKVNYLLAHEDARLKIARAGQKRVLERHTAVVRCAELDEMIQKLL